MLTSRIGSSATTVALILAIAWLPAHAAAQNLPLRDVPTSYSPAGTRVSPQDGFARQQRSAAPTPRDADGHPDLSGNWVANFANAIGEPGLRRKGAFEADQSAMQRGAQWYKPLY